MNMQQPKYKLQSKNGFEIKNKSLKNLYKMMYAESHPYLAMIRISVKPSKKLCDITGLPAPYTCPRTALRFHNLSVFKYLRSLSSEQSEKYYLLKTYGSNMMNLKK